MAGSGPMLPFQAAAIPRLAFTVPASAPLEYAAVPTVRFTVRVESLDDRSIRSILLDTQVQIAARRRAYDEEATARLFELFGHKEAWGTTLRTLLWTRATLVVPPFTGATTVDLDVPCSYDLEVAASRYFDSLAGGEVPLEFLFSGTVFYTGPEGNLQTARISWEQEAEHRMPVAVWKETLERHFRGTAWLRLRKESFDRLSAYKARHALPTWEAALDALMSDAGEVPWTP